MKNLMENVKKAQQLVQVETQKVQQELAKYVGAMQLTLPHLSLADGRLAPSTTPWLRSCLSTCGAAPSMKALTRTRL